MSRISKIFHWLFPNWKYLPVVGASRAADWSILFGGPFFFGVEIVWYAWALGLFVDCLVEFIGHKMFTYDKDPNGSVWQIAWEFVAYLGNRFGLGALAASGAWILGDGEVGVLMFVYYCLISFLTWILFQVQVNRIIFNFWSLLRKVREYRAELKR